MIINDDMIIGKYPGPGAPSDDPPGIPKAGIIKISAMAIQHPTKTNPALFIQPPRCTYNCAILNF
jgi:hypothetical protein